MGFCLHFSTEGVGVAVAGRGKGEGAGWCGGLLRRRFLAVCQRLRVSRAQTRRIRRRVSGSDSAHLIFRMICGRSLTLRHCHTARNRTTRNMPLHPAPSPFPLSLCDAYGCLGVLWLRIGFVFFILDVGGHGMLGGMVVVCLIGGDGDWMGCFCLVAQLVHVGLDSFFF